jgi:H-type small acid-soluble spore protein
MDVRRAQEIVEAPTVIEVRHNGRAVWIERVNPGDGTVQVHPQDDPGGEKQTVPVDQLTEG